MAFFDCVHGRDPSTCSVCSSERQTARLVDANERTRQTIERAARDQSTAADAAARRVAAAHLRATALNAANDHLLQRRQHAHEHELLDHELQAQLLLRDDQRAHEAHARDVAEAEDLDLLRFRAQMEEHARRTGHVYAEWEVYGLWLQRRENDRNHQAALQAAQDARDAAERDRLVRVAQEAIDAATDQVNSVMDQRTTTVGRRWRWWVGPLAFWAFVSLLNCGLVAAIVGLAVLVGAAARMVRDARRSGRGMTPAQELLVASSGLRYFFVAHGILGIVLLHGVIVAVINVILGIWLIRSWDRYRGMEAELADAKAAAAAAVADRQRAAAYPAG